MSDGLAFNNPTAPRVGKSRAARRRRRWLVGVGVLLLLTVAWFVLDALAAMKLRQALRAADALGLPRTLAEAQKRRPAVPDADNMAPALLRAGTAINAYRTPGPGENQAGHLAILDADGQESAGTRWSADKFAAARRFLRDNEQSINQIMVASELPAGRYLGAPYVLPLDVDQDHLMMHRAANRALSTRAELAAQDGDLATALATLRAMLRTDRALAGEPSVIGSLVAAATRSLTETTISHLLEQTARINDDQLAALQSGLAGWKPDLPISDGIASEHAMQRETIELTYRGVLPRIVTASAPIAPSAWVLLRLVPGLASLDEAETLGYTTSLYAALQQPETEAFCRLSCINLDLAEPPRYCILSRILQNSLHRAIELSFRELGQRRAAIVMLAIERCRLKHGAWPSGYEQLVPEFLDRVPRDPFHGKAIRIKRVRDGIRVYSIGEDRKDDDGDFGNMQQPRGKSTDWGFELLNPELRGRPAVEDAAPLTDGTASTTPSPGIQD